VTSRASWAEQKLGYRFADTALLDLALTHRSASAHNNERLEFLGDAVLGLVIARAIFRLRPDAGEGLLSRLRSRLVRGETLADTARDLGIGPLIRLGSGEARTGGFQRSSILSNALEAVLGAIYLDGGMAEAERVILQVFDARLAELPSEQQLTDAKTRLQEWLQARGHRPPVYTVLNVAGAAHAQTFEVLCAIDALGLTVAGHGASRRVAEQEAAGRALERLAHA
jgi:ribonuclease-3